MGHWIEFENVRIWYIAPEVRARQAADWARLTQVKAALPLPASDLPGIAKQQAWLAAQPVPVPPPAPAPKEHPGLATVAPLSGRVGGRWGV